MLADHVRTVTQTHGRSRRQYDSNACHPRHGQVLNVTWYHTSASARGAPHLPRHVKCLPGVGAEAGDSVVLGSPARMASAIARALRTACDASLACARGRIRSQSVRRERHVAQKVHQEGVGVVGDPAGQHGGPPRQCVQSSGARAAHAREIHLGYIPALASSSSTAVTSFSVQLRKNAVPTCATRASATDCKTARPWCFEGTEPRGDWSPREIVWWRTTQPNNCSSGGGWRWSPRFIARSRSARAMRRFRSSVIVQ